MCIRVSIKISSNLSRIKVMPTPATRHAGGTIERIYAAR